MVFDKLKWCLDYATQERLLPVILGDLFHLPRDNPNWLLSELLELLEREIIGVYGNHDVRTNEITIDDSLNVIVTAGKDAPARRGPSLPKDHRGATGRDRRHALGAALADSVPGEQRECSSGLLDLPP